MSSHRRNGGKLNIDFVGGLSGTVRPLLNLLQSTHGITIDGVSTPVKHKSFYGGHTLSTPHSLLNVRSPNNKFKRFRAL